MFREWVDVQSLPNHAELLGPTLSQPLLTGGNPPQFVDSKSNISGLACSNCTNCSGFNDQKSEFIEHVESVMCYTKRNEEVFHCLPDLRTCVIDYIKYAGETNNDELQKMHKSEFKAMMTPSSPL